MTTFTKELLSGSTNGKQIKVTASGSPGTLLHTAVTGESSLDEIWLYAVNSSATLTKLTVEYGGTSVPDDIIEVGIPAEEGYVLVVPGTLLQNSLVIRAFADTGDVILINGFVNRIAE